MLAGVAVVTIFALLNAGCDSPATPADDAATAALAARVSVLEDREAIRELMFTYGKLLDEKDLVGYSKLFAKDGVWEGGIGSAKGPEEIFRMLDTVFSRPGANEFGNSYHIISDIMISVDGDAATSRSHWTWVVEGPDGTPTGQRSGHYEDRLVREDGEWKFLHRLTVTELPTPEMDAAAEIFRKDHRDEN
jgi:ketosteroid isomerase-like protein